MGRGTILSHIGEGLYQVSRIFDTTRIDRIIEKIIAEVDEIILEKLPPLVVKETQAESLLNTAISSLNSIIAQYAIGLATKDQVDAVQSAAITRGAEYQSAKKARELMELKKASLLAQLSYLQSAKIESQTITAWCADYSKTLSGDVGLIEIEGEYPGTPVIQPDDAPTRDAAYNPARDGALTQSIGMGPAGCFLNWAMRPSWQKWKPTYRAATVLAVDTNADTVDVELFPATSIDQAIPINFPSTITGVPVEYSTCNSAVFEVGDSIVIEFTGQDWAAPKVIGFLDNPKPCVYLFKVYDAYGQLVTDTTTHEFFTASTLFPAQPLVRLFLDFELWYHNGTSFVRDKRYAFRTGGGPAPSGYDGVATYDADTQEWKVPYGDNGPYLVQVVMNSHIKTVYPDKIYTTLDDKFLNGEQIYPGHYEISLQAHAKRLITLGGGTFDTYSQRAYQIVSSLPYKLHIGFGTLTSYSIYTGCTQIVPPSPSNPDGTWSCQYSSASGVGLWIPNFGTNTISGNFPEAAGTYGVYPGATSQCGGRCSVGTFTPINISADYTRAASLIMEELYVRSDYPTFGANHLPTFTILDAEDQTQPFEVGPAY